MNQSFPTKNSSVAIKVPFTAAVVSLLVLTATTAQADWPNANKTKFSQLWDESPAGYNILAAQPPPGPNTPDPRPRILADDFPCTLTGPISDIHVWTSWLGDSAAFNIPLIPITLSIWSDVPGTPGNPSHPGINLWTETFLPGGATPGHYIIAPGPSVAPSQFWDPDPSPGGKLMGTDYTCWLYNFYPDPQTWFIQQGTAAAPTNYWLSVTAGADIVPFGWKVASVPSGKGGDNAVFGHLDSGGALQGNWQELLDPLNPTKSLNMAFAITTTNTPPPTTTPPSKWVQWPDLQSGFGLDVKATVPNPANGLQTLADDFQCTSAGWITNIQFWASLSNNVTPGPSTFVVSIWSDWPKGATGLPFSQPYQRLWTQTYKPGDYNVIGPPVTGTEQFYDPFNPSTPLKPENLVWIYNFSIYPSNHFCQPGDGRVFWVSIASISPSSPYLHWGWKTSTNHLMDASVFGIIDPSGNPLVPWQPLFNPILPAAPVPIDFAFRISTDTSTTADCDNGMSGVGNQPPDPTPGGLDVWALTPTIVGDDFLCQQPGPITGFRIWGSWLGDQVDSNALFQVMLWSDQPAVVGQIPFSHPLSVICSNVFYPPQTLQTGPPIPRYQFRQIAKNLVENFFNPNIPGPAGLVGNDTQIWQYDFYPFMNSCFFQDGGPFANGRNYWLTVSYLPQGAGTGSYVFGWKTSKVHYNDNAVFGVYPGPWTPLSNPTNGAPLDLAKMIWKFPVTTKSKWAINNTGAAVDGVQVTLQGPVQVLQGWASPPWQSFVQTSDAAFNTILIWSNGPALPPGGFTQVYYEVRVSPPVKILGWNWLNGGAVAGPVIQMNTRLVGDPTAVEFNDFYPGSIMMGDGSVEFYVTPPPMDQITPGGTRNPMETDPLPAVQGNIGPGGAAVNPVRESPSKAQYALYVMNLHDSLGNPGAMDFILMPLDALLAPAIQSISVSGGNVTLDWTSVYGRNYQLQSNGTLNGASAWGNMGGQVMAVGGDTSMTVPVGGNVSFYRVLLMP